VRRSCLNILQTLQQTVSHQDTTTSAHFVQLHPQRAPDDMSPYATLPKSFEMLRKHSDLLPKVSFEFLVQTRIEYLTLTLLALILVNGRTHQPQPREQNDLILVHWPSPPHMFTVAVPIPRCIPHVRSHHYNHIHDLCSLT